MPENVGIVGFSFGLRSESEEPNPSNRALARRVFEATSAIIRDGNIPIVVTQWEITKALQLHGQDVDHSVDLRSDGRYLDSQGVWEESRALFALLGVRQVIVIAQPFLHRASVVRMIRADDFDVIDRRIDPIPFDNSIKNTQPWTRTRRALVVYAFKTLFGGKHGHDGMQDTP